MEQTYGELQLPVRKKFTLSAVLVDGDLVAYLVICESQFASGVMQQAGQVKQDGSPRVERGAYKASWLVAPNSTLPPSQVPAFAK